MLIEMSRYTPPTPAEAADDDTPQAIALLRASPLATLFADTHLDYTALTMPFTLYGCRHLMRYFFDVAFGATDTPFYCFHYAISLFSAFFQRYFFRRYAEMPLPLAEIRQLPPA